MPAKATNPRRGLHRLECDCGNYVYAAVAPLERYGMPECPCGERLTPARADIALILGVDDCPAAAEYFARVEDARHGQAPNGRDGHAELFRAPETVAMEGTSRRKGLTREYREAARERRLSALRGTVTEPMPF